MQLKREKYTGCLVVLLLCVSFVTGGMWGGMVGGGLILWLLGPDQAVSPATVAEGVEVKPTPSPTATITPKPSPSPTFTLVLLSSHKPTPTPSISVEDAIEAVLSSVVTVINYPKETAYFQAEANDRVVGSGIIVAEQGYIVTNAHVIVNSENLSVILSDGYEISAALVVEDPDFDLALLKVEVDDLIPAPWGDSSIVRLGQPVIAIGSVLGDFPNSVTMGVVSGLNRALALDSYIVHGLIQTDAAINQGNSGGPLINLAGEVVGINTFMIREDHNQGIAQGIGFAIPASSAKAWVGAWIAQETNQAPTSLNVEEGAVLPPITPTETKSALDAN